MDNLRERQRLSIHTLEVTNDNYISAEETHGQFLDDGRATLDSGRFEGEHRLVALYVNECPLVYVHHLQI